MKGEICISEKEITLDSEEGTAGGTPELFLALCLEVHTGPCSGTLCSAEGQLRSLVCVTGEHLLSIILEHNE